MRITVSPTLIACASMLVSAVHGSLLSKLLGNIQLQLSVCPQLEINTSGEQGGGSNGKPVTQSSNPACPNYVPPEQFAEEQSYVSLADTSAESSSEPSTTGFSSSSSSSSPSTSLTSSDPIDGGIGALIEIPQQPPAEPSSAPRAYSMLAVDELVLPTQDGQVLAQNTQRQPVLPTPTQVKCVWVTHTADVGRQPAQAPGQPAADEWVPAAPTMPPVQAKQNMAPITSWLQADQGWWGTPAMNPPLPPVAQQIDTATTQTILLPDGQQQVIAESRNAGFFEYAF
ncbi:hypothetical protein IW140_006194 [Coemansia sp. RSA 1813]|nr:hypothetical protein LPJ74_005834 [Coemansia sp. RSA 1843]KAJ2092242.1 hypothetical protein IW138_001310 [Coemansia sp. RSA 986]KAJ2211288.1 hypothetical protein EV179_005598 [Coemansia sp. RSA 487]KAJ2563198.1 hypothetical protein IW140_006194 [Coemansia sp. RSA 1813]